MLKEFVEKPTIKLLRRCSDSSWNFEHIAKPSSDTSKSNSKWVIDIKKFNIDNATLLFIDSTTKYTPSRNVSYNTVIGNPPYIREETISNDSWFFKIKFNYIFEGKADIYVYFIGQSLNLAKHNGFYGIIVSNKWMRAKYGSKLRIFLRDCLDGRRDALFDADRCSGGQELLPGPGPAASPRAGRHRAGLPHSSDAGLHPVRVRAVQQTGAHGEPAVEPDAQPAGRRPDGAPCEPVEFPRQNAFLRGV